MTKIEGLVPAPIRPDASRLSDRVASELGSRIVRGDLAPGSRLPTEAELCELFSVSRSVFAMRSESFRLEDSFTCAKDTAWWYTRRATPLLPKR